MFKEHDENRLTDKVDLGSDACVTLVPSWRMRQDRGRTILYKWDSQSADWVSMPPVFGVTLALCDGHRTIGEVAAAIAYIYEDVNPREALSFVRRVLSAIASDEMGESRLCNCKGKLPPGHRKYRPADFVAPNQDPFLFGRLSIPLSLLFIPSNRCETNCIYCYAERHPISPSDELPTERWLEIIDEAAEIGIDMISFSGGDPFTRRDIDRILEHLLSYEFKMDFPTKCYISLERAARWAEIGMASPLVLVQISIDGPNPLIADFMAGSKGFYHRAMESIKNLIACGIRVRTNTVFTPYNVTGGPELARQLYELNVYEAGFTNYARSHYRHDDKLFLSLDQVQWIRDKLNAFRDEVGWKQMFCNVDIVDYRNKSVEERRESWTTRAGCSGGTTAMCITADGSVILCEQVPVRPPFVVGNVSHQSLMDIWNSDRLLEEIYPPKDKFKGTACFDCEEFDECHAVKGRCFRDSFFAFGTVYGPPPACPYAPPGPRMM